MVQVVVALAAVLVALVARPARAAPSVRQVLLLQSFDRGKLAFDYVSDSFRRELERRPDEPVNFVQFVVSPAGFANPPEREIVDFLVSAFAGRSKPDLIVTIGGPAAAFARRHRQQLFSETPLLYAAVDQRFLQDSPSSDRETAVAVVNDHGRLVDDILQLLPGTTQVFMVVGSGQYGEFWRRELGREFERFRNRLTFIWSDGLSFAEIVRRAATLPPHSAIVYFTFSMDAYEQAYSDEQVIAELRAAANAPLFGSQSAQLGHGIVGGTLLPNDDLGRRAADVAFRILDGESPGQITVPLQRVGPPLFDWRELQRWRIGESRLPPGSVVRFRGPSLWRDYQQEVLVALGVLIVQSFLIVSLLYQRRARQRAEVESRRNLTLAADANRRATVSALTGSIAHELSQPLNSILHNAQAGEMLIATNRATPDMLQEILSDIRLADGRASEIIERHRMMLRNRELEKKPVDIHAVVRDSVSFVGHDMKARHIHLELDLPRDPCMIAGDPVLLQQVLVNLLVNAMDAMVDTPPERRRLRVQDSIGANRVEVAIRDAGAGLPEQLDGRIFEPFVTTKSSGTGIGLTIAHTIVEAHRGTIDARNNPDGGATFTVTLPCSEASASV
jgi:signal transduction histidine kinase